MTDYAPVLEYIDAFWDRLIRHHPHDTGTLIGLPRPYLVPSSDPKRPLFQEMYYWDSYFMSLGLVGTHREWLILDMCENLAALVERFGFIPNGTRYYFTSRSQPPFFTRMYRLAFSLLEARGDDSATDFLRRMAARAVCEHETCWLSDKHPHERRKHRGLSRYHDINYSHFLAACESGWDHSARCDGGNPAQETGRWLDYVPVCLNSVLYHRELDLARSYSKLNDMAGAAFWSAFAAERAAVMQEVFWDAEQGFFFDFDWKAQKWDRLASLAGFYPLWSGWATPEQAAEVVQRWLPRFLRPGGLVTDLQACPGRQWSYPNGWAPLQWLVAAGLDRYGFKSEAAEVRHRWCETCATGFAANGTLLEKYNVVTPDNRPECGLYGLVEGFGWTNGVFVDFARRLGRAPGAPAHAE